MKRSRILWIGIGLVSAAILASPARAASCGGGTATFTNATSIGIPAPGTVTSTILVSGAGAYLLDLNAQTFLAHTRNGHLQVTLESPAGTVATLTSNNGGSFGGVFNGTLWDDQANPGGQVPYDVNPGLVTDHPYADGVVAARLVPEEAMGAFIGENPNGLWTLTISNTCADNPPSDTCADDSGAQQGWSLDVTSLPVAPVSLSWRFQNLNVTEISFGPSVTTTTIDVAGVGTYLGNLHMRMYLGYPVNEDLDVTLKSPAGTIVTLTTDNGGSFANSFSDTIWFDRADPAGQVPYSSNAFLVTDRAYQNFRVARSLVPEEAMAAFYGENPNGRWTVTVSNDATGSRGSIDDWSLDVRTVDGPQGDCTLTCPGDITVPGDPAQCNPTVTYPPPVASPCCGTVTCAPPSGSVFRSGTTTVVCSSDNGESCSFNVTVPDPPPPVVTVSANSTLLWPPNHKMVEVGLVATFVDVCDPNTRLDVAVYGDEDDEMQTGDGNFSPDASAIAPGTLKLRSERQGNSDGRVYLILGTATGGSSNGGYNCATVVVPHSQSKAAVASVLAQAAAARAYCLSNGTPPPGYVVVGDGPVIGPKQ